MVAVLVGFAVGAVVMHGMASFLIAQSQAIKGLRTVQARDNIAAILARYAGNRDAFNQSVSYVGAGGFPTNLGSMFNRCATGSVPNGCTANTAYGFTLTNAFGNPVAGPGTAESNTSAVYSQDVAVCGMAGTSPPDSIKCPMVAYTSFEAKCENNAANCTRASSMVINYTVAQATGVRLSAGRLRRVQGKVPIWGWLATGSGCGVGWTMVGPANTREAYCIDTTARGPGIYESAVQTCFVNDAHVCSAAEWSHACVNIGALTADMTSHAGEFVADPYADSGTALLNKVTIYGVNSGVCLNNSGVNDAYTDAKSYRCCRPAPLAPEKSP